MGLYRRKGTRFWWISYSWKGEQHFESTKSTSKALANKILGKREGEIAMQMFKVGQQGERMSFTALCKEFESAHVRTLAASTQTNVLDFLESMRKFFGDRSLSDIDAGLVADYRNHRKSQPSRMNPTRKIKGASVNRELTYLRCILSSAVERKYISENPAHGVKLFDERRERPRHRVPQIGGSRRRPGRARRGAVRPAAGATGCGRPRRGRCCIDGLAHASGSTARRPSPGSPSAGPQAWRPGRAGRSGSGAHPGPPSGRPGRLPK